MSESQMQAFTSLMDLATLDTSDLQAQTSRLAREGIYICDITKATFSEQANTDPAKPTNFNLNLEYTILEFLPLKPEDAIYAGDLVGRGLRERYFLNGKDIIEAVQLLMGKYKQAGFRHKGHTGGFEQVEPGWIDEAVNKRVAVRVRHYNGNDGEPRAAFDWISKAALEKAGIPWEVMARPFLDEHGNEVKEVA